MPPIPETAEGRDYRIVEVPFDRADVEQYYPNGFSNSALWPLYHDAIATRPITGISSTPTAESTCSSRRPPRALPPWCKQSGSTTSFQLVPAMLRSLRPDLRIGFFLLPFPAPDLFLQLPWRRPIVLGILGADLVGFKPPAVPATSWP